MFPNKVSLSLSTEVGEPLARGESRQANRAAAPCSGPRLLCHQFTRRTCHSCSPCPPCRWCREVNRWLRSGVLPRAQCARGRASRVSTREVRGDAAVRNSAAGCTAAAARCAVRRRRAPRAPRCLWSLCVESAREFEDEYGRELRIANGVFVK